MHTMGMTSLTTRIDSELKAQLQEIARYEDRSASYLANQAIRALVEERQATRELVETGLALIEQGAPSVSPGAVHNWFMADDDRPFPASQPAI